MVKPFNKRFINNAEFAGTADFYGPVNFYTSTTYHTTTVFATATTFNGVATYNTSTVYNGVATFNTAPAFNAVPAFNTASTFNGVASFNTAPSFVSPQVFNNSVTFNSTTTFNGVASFNTAPAFNAVPAFNTATTFNGIASYNTTPALANDVFLTGVDFSGASTVNMLKVSADDEIELGGALTNVGPYEFEADSGAVTVMNMPVTASAPDGTEESYSFSLDSTVVMKIKASSDGAGGVDELQMIVAPTVGNLATKPSLALGDGDTGFYESADDTLVLAIAGVAKDVITATSHTQPGAKIQTPESITSTSDGVAASLVTVQTHITTNGDQDLDNVTLADGTAGQVKKFVIKAVGHVGDSVKITPATMVGGTQITFAASPLGLGCEMLYTSAGWVVVSNNGGTIA